MKFKCPCGHVIGDQTDFLPYKGYLIADQDWEDLFEAVDAPATETPRHDWWPSLFRTVYQCAECQRLFIEDRDFDLVCFEPQSEENTEHFLGSIAGPKWKRVLVGRWYDVPVVKTAPKGVIDYSHFETEQELHNEWDAMEKAYYECFERLKREKILRFALLRKNGDLLHDWTCP